MMIFQWQIEKAERSSLAPPPPRRPALQAPLLLASCLDGNPGKAEAEVEDPVARRGPAVPRAADPGAEVPAAAQVHPERGPSGPTTPIVLLLRHLLSVNFLLPLPHVAMHVE